MQVCFLHTLFLEYATETRGNKCKAVFYRYKRIGMRSLELFWPFSILAKNLGDVLALSLSITSPIHLVTVCAIIAKNTDLSDFEINYKVDVPGGCT